MTRLIAVILVTATVSACADTTTIATKNAPAPSVSETPFGLDTHFPGLMPQ